MKRRRNSPAKIIDFILKNIEDNPRTISRMVMEKFGISRQAINRYYLRKLVTAGILVDEGYTRNKVFKIKPIIEKETRFRITPGLEEDKVW